MTLTIRPANRADLETAVGFLRDAGLPVSDLSADHLAFVAEFNGRFSGVIGLETCGDVGLLRSLLVASESRRGGIGPALVTALEVSCIADGMNELWLLTIDAEQFFSRLGYEIRDRSQAPDVIRSTPEFSGLCPGDAHLMSKRLD